MKITLTITKELGEIWEVTDLIEDMKKYERDEAKIRMAIIEFVKEDMPELLLEEDAKWSVKIERDLLSL